MVPRGNYAAANRGSVSGPTRSGRFAMHLSRTLLALAGGIKGPLALLVLIGLLMTATSLASLVFAGRAIGSVFTGRPTDEFIGFVVAAAIAAVARGVFLYLRETGAASAAAKVK